MPDLTIQRLLQDELRVDGLYRHAPKLGKVDACLVDSSGEESREVGAVLIDDPILPNKVFRLRLAALQVLMIYSAGNSRLSSSVKSGEPTTDTSAA